MESKLRSHALTGTRRETPRQSPLVGTRAPEGLILINKSLHGQQITTNDKVDFGVSAFLFGAGLVFTAPVSIAVIATGGVGYGLYTLYRDSH